MSKFPTRRSTTTLTSRKDRFAKQSNFFLKKKRAPLVKVLSIAKAAMLTADREVVETRLAVHSANISLADLQEKYKDFGHKRGKRRLPA